MVIYPVCTRNFISYFSVFRNRNFYFQETITNIFTISLHKNNTIPLSAYIWQVHSPKRIELVKKHIVASQSYNFL